MPGTWLPCLYRDSPGTGRVAPLWCFCPILQARRWLYAAAVACVLHASMNVDTLRDYITCFRLPTGSVSSGLVRLVAVLVCLVGSTVVRGFRSVLLSTWLVKKMFRCQTEVGVRDEFEQRKHLIGFQMASKPCVASIRLVGELRILQEHEHSWDLIEWL